MSAAGGLKIFVSLGAACGYDLRRDVTAPASLGLHHARGDAELADAQVVVLLHEHHGRRQQRVALATGMLREVVGELREERVLVVPELVAVARREVERVLVRHVDARDRDGLGVVHLLRQLPCQLDRLHVRAEGAAEDALDERLDPVLDAPQDAHRKRTPLCPPGTLTTLSKQRIRQRTRCEPGCGHSPGGGDGLAAHRERSEKQRAYEAGAPACDAPEPSLPRRLRGERGRDEHERDGEHRRPAREEARDGVEGRAGPLRASEARRARRVLTGEGQP